MRRRITGNDSNMPLSEAMTAFLSYCRSKNLSGRTLEYYRHRLGAFLRYMADTCPERVSLESIGPATIRDFLAYESERNSPATANHSLTSLKAFWGFAVMEDIAESDPTASVAKQKTRKVVIETFSPEQIAALLRTCDRTWYGIRDRLVILLLLDCGLRVSELVGIKLCDINTADQTMKVIGKGNAERRVPYGAGVRQALTMWLAKRGDLPCPNLIVNHYGEPILRWRIRDMIAFRGAKAGIKGVRCSPHTLRHTCAISYLRAGGDVFSLQRLLGHSTLSMTQRYCSSLSALDVAAKHHQFSPVDNLPQKAVGMKRTRCNRVA